MLENDVTVSYIHFRFAASDGYISTPIGNVFDK